MSNEIKRVPMDFAHRLNKTWPGFIRPWFRDCPDCAGGQSATRWWLDSLMHIFDLASRPSRDGSTHPWVREIDTQHTPDPEVMGALIEGLIGHPIDPPHSFSSGHRHEVTEAIVVAAGLKAADDDGYWGTCQTCDGEDIHADDRAAMEAWEPTEPPEGEGFQLWETVSEGSPISPVFMNAHSLAGWMVDNRKVSSHAGAMRFIQEGFAVTFVIRDGVMSSGIDDAGRAS